MSWQELAHGFDAAELPVMVDGREVDRILLARFDPNLFRMEVRTAPQGDKELDDWMKASGAVLIINGSYYNHAGAPDTPLLSDGILLGPARYSSSHGALIASDAFTGVVDLAGADWKSAFAGAHDAMVSYPLLLGADASSRVHGNPRWLANRSFVAQDTAGRIIVGTTREAFFSLERLGLFLKNAPLDLSRALNLDGGPVACQGIDLNGFKRSFCGAWELRTHDDKLQLLRPGFGSQRWALPIVLAVRSMAKTARVDKALTAGTGSGWHVDERRIDD